MSVVSYIFSGIFLISGFNKMWFYASPDTLGDFVLSGGINTYVGGDAYNYIINANRATGYFTLAIFFLMLGLGIHVIQTLKKNNQSHWANN